MKHCPECAALIRMIDAYIAKADGDLADELSRAGYPDGDGTLRDAAALEADLGEALNHDTEVIAEQLGRSESIEAFARDTWPTYQSASALGDDVQEAVARQLTISIPRLAAGYLAATDQGLTVTALRRRTADWITSWSVQLGGLMKLTSHEGIQSILTGAMAEGRSVADVTRELMDSGIRANYSRARATALTEMLTAHSAANQEAMMQSPAVEGKGWRHSGSRRNKPRPNHVAMDGTVVPKDQPFELEGRDGRTYRPMYPRDPVLPAGERVNCHCIHQPIVSEDILGLSLDERKALQREAIEADDRRWAVELDEENRRRSGNATFGLPINSLLPNANGGVLKPTDYPVHQPGRAAEPNAVLQRTMRDGVIERYYYDADGKIIMRLENGDHGDPGRYPFGNGGAHYNRALYDENGEFRGWSEDRCLTAKMRRLSEDILADGAAPAALSTPDIPTIAGVQRGLPMTHLEADSGHVNPHFLESRGYNINCQSCVATYEARLRGYNVEVVPNDAQHPMCKKLSMDTALVWKEPDGGRARYEIGNDSWTWSGGWEGEIPTAKRFEKRLLRELDEDGRYHLGFKWRGFNKGHIVTIGKDAGELVIYDPQSNQTLRGASVSEYLGRIQYKRQYSGTTYYQWPSVMRVDDKEFNYEVADQVMRRAGER